MNRSELTEAVGKLPLPAHIAVIMDGNGRWAQKRGQNRFSGHRAGAEALRRMVEESRRIGVQYLTVFAFSTENWARPKEEIALLMTLLEDYLDKETAELLEQDIRLNFIGDRSVLAPVLVKKIEESMRRTAECRHMTLTIAVNYGGRQDICHASAQLAAEIGRGVIKPEDINERLFASRLYTADMPDVDLLIRTSGEQRISNFMLWQSAYAELYITGVLWPDFDGEELLKAIYEYQHRTRRFGGLQSGVK